ncbi:hypothetical protein OSB04_un001132 [Centaurea solstitialis]|uniref:Integrase catalytic domain-containing protein n=1 Tax=Centaurea solstitialis TaxID=347529 RepID=A0AA38W2W7_9ASTR|nr:hypothetical protein OSB04_un001132 [Centaurea solstitialis]
MAEIKETDIPTEAYKANELQFEYDHNYWKWEKKELERKLSKEKEEVESARKELSKAKEDLDKFSKSSKALESIIRAQVTDDLKRGIGYNSTPPPYNQNYIPPTTALLERIDRSEMKEGLDRIDPVDSEEESDETTRKDKGKSVMTSENKGKKTETTRKENRKDHYTQRTVVEPVVTTVLLLIAVVTSNISSNNSNTATSQVNTAASNNSSGNSNNVTTDNSSLRKPIITKYSSHEIPNKDYLLKLNRLTESNQGRRSSLWHVDSGCSRHMTGIMSLLEDFKRFEGGHVAFGDNPNGGKISGKGKVSKGKMTFDDVYFVEQLKYNLLSVSQVCDKKFGVFFTDTECLILAPGYKIDESKVMLRTPRKDNVYCLDIEDASSLSSLNCLFSKAPVSESSLWHRRMCHMNFKNMNLLVKNNLVRGLPAKEFSCDDHCVACLKGKQHKNSHKSKEVNTISSPLQLLHMDLFGPTNVMSIGKKSYCLVIVDDYSRFTWVYFLRTKDETSGLIKPFVTRVENKTNLRVKVIRSDNGTEFKNADLNSFCEEKGIERQYSAPRTPQQNGVAERRNRTLIEAARTMLADSKLPITFWAEAVNTACYVQNRANLKAPGFEDPKYPDKVYKLRKALYGLHQAPRAWYDTLSSYLLENKFERGVIDKTLFIKRAKTDMLLVQIYVDDIIFGSTKDDMCKEFEELMHKKFKMSSMGELTFFLGLQVKQKPEGIFINQSKYVTSMLQKFGMNDAKPASTPMETHKHLTADVEGEDVDVHHYRSMIGSLMYLTASRPDIMFAVCVCARYQVRPKESHLHAVKRIFKYLKGQPRLGLWYPNDSSFDLVAYTDSDYGGANMDRKSTSGGCQFLGGRLVSWQCKKQTTVSQSTTEAEYIAASQCCSQVLWIQNQMQDYGLSFLQTPIYIDNNNAISIVNNPVKHSKTKHIEIKYHYIRDCNEKKIIQVLKVHTDDQYADLFTKAFDVGRYMVKFLV